VTTTPKAGQAGLAPRTLLVLAAIAVGFAAADTYVVVLALPDMMASVGLNIDELQRAAPIVSGFLLGYIAMLPLIGRIADLRGRVPVLVGSLVIFSIGSLVTAAEYDLTSMVFGRFLQGVGGGGLVPATLALVADIWTVDRRGLPLGVVGAVQELGSVVGPLYGALVLAVSTWQTIFWINFAVGLVLAVALVVLARTSDTVHDSAAETGTSGPRSAGHPDWLGGLLAAAAVAALALVLTAPERLTSGLTTGRAYIPYVGDSRWTTPMAMALVVLAVAFVVRELTAHRPLVDLRASGDVARAADLPGATLLGLALAGIVLAFATADPEVQVFSPAGPYYLAGSAVAAVLFVWRQRVAPAPLIPHDALIRTAAWGSIVVSFFVGSSLIAALVDIPIFARVTTYPDSQLGAALVLVRFLAALPVGALVGGWLSKRYDVGVLAGIGMVMAALSFVWMAQWDKDSLDHVLATGPLILGGFGFGIAIAPVNAALLAATKESVHGIASALLVVARMVGMLVGISALTTIGLRRFYAVQADRPSISDMCDTGRVCDAYVDALKEAGIAQMHAIFWGAGVAAVIAAVLAVSLLHHRAATPPR
jgi:MFS transporter, DHA2 family, triacylglyceride efflux pump